MFDITTTYTDYDDEKQTETLWFHLNKQDILDNLDLKEQIEEFQAIFTEQKRTLSQLEVKQILELVKRMVRLSYGERSEDRKRFKKASSNPDVWDNFFESAVYDQFLTDLFVPEPIKAFEFLLAVMPKDLRLQAEEQVKRDNPEAYADYETALRSPGAAASQLIADVQEARANGARPEFGPPASAFVKPAKDISSMSREEIEATLKALTDGKSA